MPALTRDQYDILVVTLSWIIGFLPLFVQRARGRQGPTWLQCVGIALVATSFVRMLLGVYLSIGALFVFTVLEPVSTAALWRSVGRDILFDLAIPLMGLLLLSNAVPGFASARAPRGDLRATLAAEGLGPRATYRRDALHGFTLFFLLAIAYTVALTLSKQISSTLAGGDESLYWQNLTLPLIILLSSMAGITEEILFRGILLTRLARVMPWIAAAVIQAVFFGFIHAGYGTWTHVLAPAAFGLGMAWISRILGIVPAILLHVQIDLLFFGLEVSDVVPSAWIVIAVLAGLNVYAAWRTRFESVHLLWNSLRTWDWSRTKP